MESEAASPKGGALKAKTLIDTGAVGHVGFGTTAK